MTPRLSLQKLAKSFGENHAVRGVDLRLEAGEFISLLGPSGCGKSTTLAMIAGFETPTSGDIHVDGKRINDVAPGARAIGLVFQDYAVFSRLTVRDNLAFGLEAQGIAKGVRATRIDAISKTLDIEGILGRRGASLNMSEMQRVALARVLVTEPRLLLLDEPMSNLDATLRTSLRSELKLLQKQLSQTVLYVTHDQVEALAMSDRIAVMHNGVIEQIGTPEEIYKSPKTRFVAEFIGDPPINIIDCDILKRGRDIAVTTAIHGPVKLDQSKVSEGKYQIAVRPHDFVLSDKQSADAAKTTVRFLENHGVTHVAYCGYGDDIVSVAVPAGSVSPGDECYLSFNPGNTHLIHAESGMVVSTGESA